jgi:hypothetical protein
MAIKGAVRWRPDAFRSPLTTTVANLDPTATPPAGQVVMIAQLVAYDETAVTGANYRAGDPATERELVILYEEPVSMELAAFDGLTNAAAAALWSTALDAFKARVLPAGPVLVKAIRAARIAPPVLI